MRLLTHFFHRSSIKFFKNILQETQKLVALSFLVLVLPVTRLRQCPSLVRIPSRLVQESCNHRLLYIFNPDRKTLVGPLHTARHWVYIQCNMWAACTLATPPPPSPPPIAADSCAQCGQQLLQQGGGKPSCFCFITCILLLGKTLWCLLKYCFLLSFRLQIMYTLLQFYAKNLLEIFSSLKLWRGGGSHSILPLPVPAAAGRTVHSFWGVQ